MAALEATFLTKRIAKLILYEPPLQDPVDRNLAVADTIDRMIRDGDRGGAVVAFVTEVGGFSPSEVAAMKARPSWPELVATIDSHPRQMRALATYRFDAARMTAVSMPTLLLMGSETESPYIKQAIGSLQESLPNPTLIVLEGQQHNAMDGARELLADAIIDFLLDNADNRDSE